MKNTGTALALALCAAVASTSAAQSNPRVYTPQFENDGPREDIPAVQIWLDESSYSFGDIIRPHVASDNGAYMTVVRVTADGELHVLYPRLPGEQVPYRAAQFANDRLPINTTGSFLVRESRGVGFVFAVASYYKFNYRYYTIGKNCNTSRLSAATRFGSPFQIVLSFVEEITEGSESYSMDYVMYDVSGDRYRSRYASRFRGYGYDDYYDLCLGAFGNWYSSYCRGYYGNGYGYPYVVVRTPNSPRSGPAPKELHVKPLVHDPSVGDAPRERPVEGILPQADPREQSAIARRERMLRSTRERRNEPVMTQPRSEPRSEPRTESRPAPRSEPRMAPPPNREPARAAPVIRSEPRVERPHVEAPAPRIERSERPKKDN